MEDRGVHQNRLILKLDKTKGMIDITDKVRYINDEGNSYFVSFISGKSYHISFDDLEYYPCNLIVRDEEYAFLDGVLYRNVNELRFFDPFNKAYLKNGKVIKFSKYKRVFNKEQNEINFKNVIPYYADLARYSYIITRTEEVTPEKLISMLYEKNINNNSTPLFDYLRGSFSENNKDYIKFIYPFGTNLSQMKAIKNAFDYDISVIEGPPGTGKTQTILNIIANAICNNEKVAVVSNNNEAIKNVYDKMQKMGIEFLIANLGNTDKVESFFDSISNIDFAEKYHSLDFNGASEKTLSKISELSKKYEKYCELVNGKAKLEEEIKEINLEFAHYQAYYHKTDFVIKKSKKWNSNDVLLLKNYICESKKKGLVFKIKLFFDFKVPYKKIKENISEFISNLEYVYYEKKINEIENTISEINNELASYNKETLMDFVKLSKDYYFMKIAQNVPDKLDINADNYKMKSEEMMSMFPVLLSTTHSLLRNVKFGYKFDLLIIDEASQSDIMTSLLCFGIAERVVIVGDMKQLQQIDNEKIYDYSDKIAKKYSISKSYQYKDNSILKSIIDSIPNVPRVLLKEHYRCNQSIISFCNKRFYGNELIVLTNDRDDSMNVVVTVQGNHARKNMTGTGQYNDREKEEIIKIIEEEKDKEIGIISPFRAQVEYLNNSLSNYSNVEIDTVHKYQGREKEVVILSTVVNDIHVENEEDRISNFINNPALLNVAISRAVKKLYLVTSDGIYKSERNNLKELISYIEYITSGNGINKGTVVSVFDYLYEDNFNSLQILRTRYNKISNFDSENLFYSLFNKILKEYEITDMKIAPFVRLNSLLSDISSFSEDEQRYINHYLTHVDFVCFSRISMKPLFAIEIDGVKYHEKNDKQLSHDDIKTRALEENGIKVFRFKTNEANEKEKIMNIISKYSLKY